MTQQERDELKRLNDEAISMRDAFSAKAADGGVPITAWDGSLWSCFEQKATAAMPIMLTENQRMRELLARVKETRAINLLNEITKREGINTPSWEDGIEAYDDLKPIIDEITSFLAEAEPAMPQPR